MIHFKFSVPKFCGSFQMNLENFGGFLLVTCKVSMTVVCKTEYDAKIADANFNKIKKPKKTKQSPSQGYNYKIKYN